NAQDTNGNTVLHMCVIHENLEMLRLAIELGASLKVKNKQKLSPLTLAAKLAKNRMFTELLEHEAMTQWEYSKASKTFYPLNGIDTINQDNGDIDDSSALSLAVYGDKTDHLALLDGLLEEVLQAKWDTFARREVVRSLGIFSLYYVFFFTAYMERPFSMATELETKGAIDGSGRNVQNVTDYDDSHVRCHLIYYSELPFEQGWLRLGCEIAVITLIAIQIVFDVRDVRQIGWGKWITVYKAFPAKVIYKITWGLVLLSIPLRALCFVNRNFFVLENYLVSTAVIMTTVHFLFFCRAVKFVGPFVLMIYTIIATDLRRFILIYSIFLVGFSQSFYIIFYSCEWEDKNTDGASNWTNVMDSPQESIIRTFMLNIGEFNVFYRQLATCPQKGIAAVGKGVFLFFKLCVSILLVNLLIAMMTRSYLTIAKTTQEYKRQWAKVILMLEVSVKPQDRLSYMVKYSVPTGMNKLIRSFSVTKKIDPQKMSEHEKEKRMKTDKEIVEERQMLYRKKKAEMELKAEIRSQTTTKTIKVARRMSYYH
ncbi:hypothetical protein PRIPAC_77623, partial [Pristionchus pacificus]